MAWELEQAGWRVLLEAWDFAPGSAWVQQMDEAVREATRTLAVLSPAYLDSVYGRAEWQAAWAGDPLGRQRKLLTVRVRECSRPGLLGQVVGVDLFGVAEPEARRRLVGLVRAVAAGRAKPDLPPNFPLADGTQSDQPRFPTLLPELWNVPARIPIFTGRDRELAELRARLAADCRVVLHGIGGVGKSQLAVEYAHQNSAGYNVVWWLQADQPALARERVAQLADRLGIPLGADVSAALSAELERRRPTLLIFDDAADPEQIVPLLPIASAGHVLVTSRDPRWQDVASQLRLDVLTHADAVHLLRKKLDWLDDSDADRLARALGELPLALAQAATFLGETGIPARTYLDLLGSRTSDLLSEGTPASYPRSLAASWRLSMQRLHAEDPAAEQLLRLSAFLATAPIPLGTFPAAAGHLPPELDASVGDALAFRRMVARIARYARVGTWPRTPTRGSARPWAPTMTTPCGSPAASATPTGTTPSTTPQAPSTRTRWRGDGGRSARTTPRPCTPPVASPPTCLSSATPGAPGCSKRTPSAGADACSATTTSPPCARPTTSPAACASWTTPARRGSWTRTRSPAAATFSARTTRTPWPPPPTSPPTCG